MQHRPRKRFGQNFLQSPQVIDAIIRAMYLKANDKVIEIGPGQGALTEPLLQKLDALTAIEIDRDLHARLLALPNANKLTLLEGDALEVDFGTLGEHCKIVGNLPYNISTPLILHLLHYVKHIEDMFFMLQKEVVERLVATPGTKDYGRLSVMVQYYCDTEHLFDVPPEVFFPKPKVNSAVVRLSPYPCSPYPFVAFKDLEFLVKKAFSMRRKTLANNLKTLVSATELEALNIEPSIRPEQVPVKDYVQIVKFITK